MQLFIKNISTSIDNKQIINDINLSLNRGEVSVIIGPNGAGKSTLLKSICNLLKPSKGEVIYNDDNIINKSTLQISKLVSYMGQFSQNSNLIVKDILELGRRTHSGFTLDYIDNLIISDVVKELNLEKFLDRNIDTLSGGEKQKILLATALIQKPKILLLDEPISHLDPKNQQEILEIVKKVTIKEKLITIVVLHDLQNALHYGDKLLLLKSGKLIYTLEKHKIESHHIEELYDISCKIFKNEGHYFVLLGHHHTNSPSSNHTH
ncbi:ABC transporter ATP-binding protein [Arcobacter sp. FWKO B]|uniref:ABC transporter ATP-binding protein n=1 Tax=Arcobacter sp. FWKO B TaxID=2593672 RepID=UPI0018A37CD2|nr:ABC transporter ATP-binding protein [Arcobacter sp. FWKO B]QOG12589.1 ABC transporter ATP-binding protein [Arcobacter sp. FWKO B]